VTFLVELVIAFIYVENVHHDPYNMEAEVTPSRKRAVTRYSLGNLREPILAVVLQLENFFHRRDLVNLHNLNLRALGHL
jgi:hypothetical protein